MACQHESIKVRSASTGTLGSTGRASMTRAYLSAGSNKFFAKKNISRQSLLFVVLCLSVTVIIYQIPIKHLKDDSYISLLPHFKFVKQLSKKNECSKGSIKHGIDQLPNNIELLSNTSSCAMLYEKYLSIFQLEVYNASQRLGGTFLKKMNKWLGNNSVLIKLAEHQTIVTIHDILRQRTTVFNPLRSKRPVSNSQNSVVTYLKNISESSKVTCDFCSPFNMTAEDVFGRILGKYSVSASNAFKLAKWHSLFIPFEHSMLNINIDIHLDIFNTSLKWFDKVHSIDKNAKFPVFFMDVFPHSGASQIHVHAHGVMGLDHYPGQFQDIFKIAESFQRIHKANYWETIISIHETLGLSFKFGEVSIISPLVPQREHEIWLLSERPSTEFFNVLFFVIKMYEDHLQKFCFSMSGAFPQLGTGDESINESPISLIMIGTRGDCSSPTNDISSLELYLFNNVNTDPYETVGTLQKNIDYYSEKYSSDLKMINLWT